MKIPKCLHLFILGWLVFCPRAQSQEIPLFGELPKLDKQWVLARQAANQGSNVSHFWIVFTNAHSGDTLSFDAKRYGKEPQREPNLNSWWGDGANDTLPGGYPMGYKFSLRDWVGIGIRMNIVELSALDEVTKKSVLKKVLEYTNVFQQDEPGTNYLAHGYAMALGNLAVFVQNTSTKVITPELAQGMAESLIYIHLNRRSAQRQAPPKTISP